MAGPHRSDPGSPEAILPSGVQCPGEAVHTNMGQLLEHQVWQGAVARPGHPVSGGILRLPEGIIKEVQRGAWAFDQSLCQLQVAICEDNEVHR